MAARKPTCTRGISKRCGKVCIPIAHTCHHKRVTKPPTCKKGLSRKCGKICISMTRNCKKDGTQGVKIPKKMDNKWSALAIKASLLANRVPVGSSAKSKLEKSAVEAMRKADISINKWLAGVGTMTSGFI